MRMSKQYIWKYPVPANDCDIMIPSGGKILSVGLQGKVLVVWALVNPEAPKIPRHIQCINTGDSCEVHPNAHFLGTVTTEGGIVWHVFSSGGVA